MNFSPELLCHIFQDGTLSQVDELEDYVSEKQGDCADVINPGGPDFPTSVSHVCSKWRAVAINQSFLWSTIVVFHDSKIPFDGYSEWIKRSKDCDLNIVINCINQDSGSLGRKFRALVSLLASHSGRWCGAMINVAPSKRETEFQVLKMICPDSPMSRIYRFAMSSGGLQFHPTTIPDHNSRPKKAVWGGNACSLVQIVLTTVVASWSALSLLLTSAPALELLSVNETLIIDHVHGFHEIWDTKITLPSLKTLQIDYEGTGGSAGFLISLLIAPKLTNLEITGRRCSSDVDDPQEVDVPILCTSGVMRGLQHVSFSDLKISGLSDVIQLYQNLPSLRSLELDSVHGIRNEFLDALVPAPGKETLLPQLLDLTVYGHGEECSDFDARQRGIMAVVSGRLKAGTRIRKLIVGVKSALSCEELEWLQSQVSEVEQVEIYRYGEQVRIVEQHRADCRVQINYHDKACKS